MEAAVVSFYVTIPCHVTTFDVGHGCHTNRVVVVVSDPMKTTLAAASTTVAWTMTVSRTRSVSPGELLYPYPYPYPYRVDPWSVL